MQIYRYVFLTLFVEWKYGRIRQKKRPLWGVFRCVQQTDVCLLGTHSNLTDHRISETRYAENFHAAKTKAFNFNDTFFCSVQYANPPYGGWREDSPISNSNSSLLMLKICSSDMA